MRRKKQYSNFIGLLSRRKKIGANPKDIKSLMNNQKAKVENNKDSYIKIPTKLDNKLNFNSFNKSNYVNYAQGTQTIDSSSRKYNSNIYSINNECSFKNQIKKGFKDVNKKNSQVSALRKYISFSKSFNNVKPPDINDLANEVLKPTFLKSDFSSSLFNFYHSNTSKNINLCKGNKMINDIIYRNY